VVPFSKVATGLARSNIGVLSSTVAPGIRSYELHCGGHYWNSFPKGCGFFLHHVLTYCFTHALCSAPVPKRLEFEDNTYESESHHQYLSSRQVDMDRVELVFEYKRNQGFGWAVRHR
jgi:hypothetical protein